MNYDSLKEQAEKLDLLQYLNEDKVEVAKEEQSPQKPSAKKNKVMKGGSLPESMRNKTEIVQLKNAIKSKKKLEEDIDKLVSLGVSYRSTTKLVRSTPRKCRRRECARTAPRSTRTKFSIFSTTKNRKAQRRTRTFRMVQSQPQLLVSRSTSYKTPLPKVPSSRVSSRWQFGVEPSSQATLEEERNTAKARVLKNKQKKKQEEQKRMEMELMQICKQNQAVNAEARKRAKNEYRSSSAMQGILGEKHSGEKKIEEGYSLYNHPVDDDLDDGYLESIMEDVDAEDEEDKELRENIRAKRKKLEETKQYITEITTKINRNDISELSSNAKSEEVKLDDVAESDVIKEEHQEEINSEDEEDLAQYLENQDDEEDEEEMDEVYKNFEENITLVKLRDKLKLLRHR